MNKHLLALLPFFILSLFAEAQISITADDFPKIGTILRSVNGSANGGFNIGVAGANQIYDLSAISPEDTTTTTFINPAGTPGAGAFPSATLASSFEEGFLYYQETASEAFFIGSYIDTSENNTGAFLAFPFDPTQKILELPSTFNTSYTDTWGFTITIVDTTGFADSLRNITSTVKEVLFDGYGTVITPDGSYNGLRERTFSTTTTSAQALVSGIWATVFSNESRNTSYTWYAKEVSGPLVSVSIENGQVSTVSYTIVESTVTAPVAAFTFTDQGDGVVDFLDGSSNNPTGWSWDFGDGSTSTDQNPQHSYSTPGTYNVCLTASNSQGSNTTCSDVQISLAPVAAFTFTDQGDGVVDFLDGSSNNPTGWSWDFGDGSTSTDQNPQHSYSTPGTYNVCLTASNSQGSNTTCSDVQISLAPVAAFTFTDQGDGIVDFLDASNNNPTGWSWSFGDGNISTEQNPQHTYTIPGTFNVCLTASNSRGSNTTCSDVQISLAPVAIFTFTDQGDGIVDFLDASNNNPTSWSWDFGDGNISTEQNPQHIYTTPAVYNVCLTAGNSAGSDMICQEIDIMVTSIPTIDHLMHLTIAPNPVKDRLILRLESDTFDQLFFTLINPIGQVVLEKQLRTNEQYRFDLGPLSSGIYYYQLKNKIGQLGSRGSILKID